MDHRRFRGQDGRTWEAWAVYPAAVERRVTGSRVENDLDGEERRHRDVRLQLPEPLQAGWLAFQNGDERRRLAPIPEGWESLSEEELAALLRVATPAAPLEMDQQP